MKKFWIILLVITLVAAIGYIILLKKGGDIDTVLNSPSTIDLTVETSDVENALLTSLVKVQVTNHSSRTHNNVHLKLTAFDKEGNIVKEKDVLFDRTLQPNSSFSKMVTLPARAKSCTCVVESSDPS